MSVFASPAGPLPSHEPDRIRPRRVRFDWTETPYHWVPGDPGTSNVIDMTHLLFPAAERWFIQVFKQALPLIEDPALYERVKGFMGQEGTHAVSHQVVLDRHFQEHGVDPSPFTRRLEWFFDDLLGERPGLPPRLRRLSLYVRLAAIAGIEHYTAVLGQWILDDADALDEAGADPVMMDLLRWHGAEEVEHRSVAYDLYQHLCGSYALRSAVTAALVFPLFNAWATYGVLFLLHQDPQWRLHPRDVGIWWEGSRRRRLPSYTSLAAAGYRYLRRGYHPSDEGDLASALAYIERSPAHLAAGPPSP